MEMQHIQNIYLKKKKKTTTNLNLGLYWEDWVLQTCFKAIETICSTDSLGNVHKSAPSGSVGDGFHAFFFRLPAFPRCEPIPHLLVAHLGLLA